MDKNKGFNGGNDESKLEFFGFHIIPPIKERCSVKLSKGGKLSASPMYKSGKCSKCYNKMMIRINFIIPLIQ